MNKFLTTILICFSTAFAADSQVDLRIDTNPYNLHAKSSFSVTTTTAMKTTDENHAILATPEMSFYTNGGIDFSVSTAHRHRWKDWVIGHTVFFDRSHIEVFSLDQIGTGLDLQTKAFDFRVNYYHPITNLKNTLLTACKWVDSEIFFKTPYFGIGTGPLYNVDMQAWALHSRIVIPMKSCSFNFGAICGGGDYAQTQAIFSLSFHLFKPSKSDALISPPCHVQKSNIYYHSSYSYDPETKTVKLDYNPNLVTYIDQSEDDMTLQEKDTKEKTHDKKEAKEKSRESANSGW